MKPRIDLMNRSLQSGFTLVELLIAMLISAFLIIGLIQIVTAASSSFRLQDNQSEVQENGRHIISTLGKLIRQTGFNPQPWNLDNEVPGLSADTLDHVTARSDRLVIRSWSNTNCFDNRNPVEDEFGEAAFFIRETLFDLNSQKNLAQTCRYGPASSELVTQINHQGFVPNVESFQLLYGEDRDDDGQVDHWVRGGEWSEQQQVLGIRIAVLLSSTDPVVEPRAQTFSLLDAEHRVSANGKLYRLVVFATAIKGRSG